jgi:ankyrin repeat protein
MYAATFGHLDCLQALKDAGADLNIRNKDGLTAWWCAHHENNDECLELLKGANRGPYDTCCDKVMRQIIALPSNMKRCALSRRQVAPVLQGPP